MKVFAGHSLTAWRLAGSKFGWAWRNH